MPTPLNIPLSPLSAPAAKQQTIKPRCTLSSLSVLLCLSEVSSCDSTISNSLHLGNSSLDHL